MVIRKTKEQAAEMTYDHAKRDFRPLEERLDEEEKESLRALRLAIETRFASADNDGVREKFKETDPEMRRLLCIEMDFFEHMAHKYQAIPFEWKPRAPPRPCRVKAKMAPTPVPVEVKEKTPKKRERKEKAPEVKKHRKAPSLPTCSPPVPMPVAPKYYPPPCTPSQSGESEGDYVEVSESSEDETPLATYHRTKALKQ